MNKVVELSSLSATAIEPESDPDQECPKASVDRWFREDIAAKANVRLAIVAALEDEGFVRVRIWREDYEQCFDLWHFSCALGSIPNDERVIRRVIGDACAKTGFRVKKDLLAVIVENGRCRAMVTLRNTETARWIRLP